MIYFFKIGNTYPKNCHHSYHFPINEGFRPNLIFVSFLYAFNLRLLLIKIILYDTLQSGCGLILQNYNFLGIRRKIQIYNFFMLDQQKRIYIFELAIKKIRQACSD